MQNEIKFIILTKSARHGGNCVVGINIDNEEIIRLVSNNDKIKGSLSDDNMKYPNGEIAQPLDIVQLKLVKHLPEIYQPENYLLDETYQWKKIKNATFQDILPYISDENDIFDNNIPFLTDTNINNTKKSIMVIRVKNVKLYQYCSLYDMGNIKPKTKIDFLYKSKPYEKFSVTDRDYFGENCEFTDAILVVTLPAKPYHDYYYKFVSKILPLKKVEK